MSQPRIDRPQGPSEDGASGSDREADPEAEPRETGPRETGPPEAGREAAPRGVDRGAVPRPRSEPVLALTAAVAAGAAQLLTDTGGLWVVLDIGAVLAAVSAVAMLLRALASERRQPALGELATGVVTAGICTAVLLLALHGPEAHLGALVFEVAAAMGAVLTLLIIGGASVRYLRERDPAPDDAPDAEVGAGVGLPAGLVTLLGAIVAIAVVVRDAALR